LQDVVLEDRMTNEFIITHSWVKVIPRKSRGEGPGKLRFKLYDSSGVVNLDTSIPESPVVEVVFPDGRVQMNISHTCQHGLDRCEADEANRWVIGHTCYCNEEPEDGDDATTDFFAQPADRGMYIIERPDGHFIAI